MLNYLNAQTITTSMAKGGLNEYLLILQTSHSIISPQYSTALCPHPILNRVTGSHKFPISPLNTLLTILCGFRYRVNRFLKALYPLLTTLTSPFYSPFPPKGDINANWRRIKKVNRAWKGKEPIHTW